MTASVSMWRRPPGTENIRVLDPTDLGAFLELAAADPIVNVFPEHRARVTRLDPRWLGGEVWGMFADSRLVAAVHAATNLVPVGCTPDQARAFGAWALVRPRRAGTIVGRSDVVSSLWSVVAPHWGPVREMRVGQPHLELHGAPAVAGDPRVRPSRPEDLEALYPACVAMYTEEVGVSPEAGGSAAAYRTRVSQLVAREWSFVRIDAGRVVFKAEVACATPSAAQIQGVWVPPDLRGHGLAAAGVAAVASHVLRDVAPVVSLYVNDYNAPARAAYRRVGFRETARFTTIMLA